MRLEIRVDVVAPERPGSCRAAASHEAIETPRSPAGSRSKPNWEERHPRHAISRRDRLGNTEILKAERGMECVNIGMQAFGKMRGSRLGEAKEQGWTGQHFSGNFWLMGSSVQVAEMGMREMRPALGEKRDKRGGPLREKVAEFSSTETDASRAG